jgi:lipid-A-disaccharide synthase
MQVVADLRETTALGVGEVAAHLFAIARAHARILAAVKRERPRAALLVNYSEYNAHLAPKLKARGVRVLWYGAPQVWAWRPTRAPKLAAKVDAMAVMLPFEEELWRKAGAHTRYVGHPALEVQARGRDGARALLGLTPLAPCVAIMPGSRPHEVRALLEPMLEGYEHVRRDRASLDARVLVASSLDRRTRAYAMDMARARHVDPHLVDAREGAPGVLAAFDVTLCASGTASLEAALAGAVPVVAYKVGLATELVARALVHAPFVALPNVLLGRPAFSELLQRDVQPRRFAQELVRALDGRRHLLAACKEVADVLGGGHLPSSEVARMLVPWLGVRDDEETMTPPRSAAWPA